MHSLHSQRCKNEVIERVVVVKSVKMSAARLTLRAGGVSQELLRCTTAVSRIHKPTNTPETPCVFHIHMSNAVHKIEKGRENDEIQ